MTSERRQKAYRAGLFAEALSAFFLTFKGYRLLARRHKTPVGEIDLIAKRGRTLVFIEVKARGAEDSAAHAVSPRQQERIRRAASAFLAQNPALAGLNCRFDAVLYVPWRSWRHIVDAWQ